MAWQAESSLRLADRRKLLLTLGAPYALLLLASLVAWPWRALDIPGAIGTLTPPSFVLLVFTLSASTYAMRRRLPLSMITWLPAGQGAIVLLATGFFAGGTPNELTGLAFIVSYVFIFLIVLALTTAIASNGGPIAISFMGFFVFTQAMRFPIFEAATDGPVPAASFFTLVAVILAAAEVVVLAWLARRLVEAADESTIPSALWITAFVLAHGVLAGWEEPLLRGTLTFLDFSEQVLRWLTLAGIQLGMAAVLIRFRRAQFREQAIQEAAPVEQPALPEESPPPEPEPEAARERRTRPQHGGRPTPRRRRQR